MEEVNYGRWVVLSRFTELESFNRSLIKSREVAAVVWWNVLVAIGTIGHHGMLAQQLDSSWQLTVAGQTVFADDDGTFRIDNIAAPDLFGPDGPGTVPDFLSDDPVRLTGVSLAGERPRYVFSEPFRIRGGATVALSFSDLVFTDTPPPVVDVLRVRADRPTLTQIGATTQVRATARVADGSELDVTPATAWTIYRTSNPGVATVDRDGVITTRGKGMAFITASNDGVTAVTQIDVLPGAPLTTISGFVLRRSDDSPIEGVNVQVIGLAGLGTTDRNGQFVIEDVPTNLGSLSLSLQSDAGALLLGFSRELDLVAGGISDGGIIRATSFDELTEGECTDQDGDCLPTAFELAYGLDPFDADSDDDGVNDGDEDPDGDQFSNRLEVFFGTNPLEPDTDDDGLSDRVEVLESPTDPLEPDTDLDGRLDGEELLDAQNITTNPMSADTDGDGWQDGTEIADGTDPRDPMSTPSIFVTVESPITLDPWRSDPEVEGSEFYSSSPVVGIDVLQGDGVIGETSNPFYAATPSIQVDVSLENQEFGGPEFVLAGPSHIAVSAELSPLTLESDGFYVAGPGRLELIAIPSAEAVEEGGFTIANPFALEIISPLKTESDVNGFHLGEPRINVRSFISEENP